MHMRDVSGFGDFSTLGKRVMEEQELIKTVLFRLAQTLKLLEKIKSRFLCRIFS